MKYTVGAALCLALAGCVGKPIIQDNGTVLPSLTRSIPEHMTDIGIERYLLNEVNDIDKSGKHRIAINAYQGSVLLTGEVPNQNIKDELQARAMLIKQVQHVYNFLTITNTPKSQSHTVHDNYLKAKVDAKLLTNSNIKFSQYQIVVRDDIAYVMGSMTQPQQDIIAKTAASVDGLAGVRFLTTVFAFDEAQDTPSTTQNRVHAPVQSPAPNAPNSPLYLSQPAAMMAPLPNYNHHSKSYGGAGFDNGIDAPNTSSVLPIGQTNSGYIELYQGTTSP